MAERPAPRGTGASTPGSSRTPSNRSPDWGNSRTASIVVDLVGDVLVGAGDTPSDARAGRGLAQCSMPWWHSRRRSGRRPSAAWHLAGSGLAIAQWAWCKRWRSSCSDKLAIFARAILPRPSGSKHPESTAHFWAAVPFDSRNGSAAQNESARRRGRVRRRSEHGVGEAAPGVAGEGRPRRPAGPGRRRGRRPRRGARRSGRRSCRGRPTGSGRRRGGRCRRRAGRPRRSRGGGSCSCSSGAPCSARGVGGRPRGPARGRRRARPSPRWRAADRRPARRVRPRCGRASRGTDEHRRSGRAPARASGDRARRASARRPAPVGRRRRARRDSHASWRAGAAYT